MNIHIKEESLFKELVNSSLIKVRVGSHLFGAENSQSDTDIFHIYAQSQQDTNSFCWTHHQLQFKQDNTDYLFVTLQNFIRNLLNGDSTINFEILYSEEFKNHQQLSHLVSIRDKFVTYNLLKCYLGTAKRDLKLFKKENNYKRLYHALRGYQSYLAIISGSYQNDWISQTSLDRAWVSNLKSGKIDVMEGKRLHDEISKNLETLRSELNQNLNDGKIKKMMTGSDLRDLDKWSLSIINSEDFKSVQCKTFIDLTEKYDSLYLDLKYD